MSESLRTDKQIEKDEAITLIEKYIIELEADNAKLRKEVGGWEETLVRLNDKCVKIRRKLEAENAKLREALEKYSYHLAECSQGPFRYDFHDPKPCSCGLGDALKDSAEPAGDDPCVAVGWWRCTSCGCDVPPGNKWCKRCRNTVPPNHAAEVAESTVSAGKAKTKP